MIETLPYYFWIFVIFATLFILSGVIALIIVFIYNNKRLKHESDYLIAILQSLNEIIIITKPNGELLKYNELAKKIFLLPENNDEELNILQFQSLSFIQDINYHNSKNKIELTHEIGNNYYIIQWQTNIYTGIYDDIDYHILTGIDLTSLRTNQISLTSINLMLEQRLTQYTLELQTIISEAPFGFIFFNRNGTLTQVNNNFIDMLENKNEVNSLLYGFNLFENKFILNDEIEQKVKSLFTDKGNYLSNIVPSENLLTNITFKKTVKWVTLKSYTLLDVFHKVNRVVLIIENLTEYKAKIDLLAKIEINQLRTNTMLEIIESERKRIAQDLHDSVQQLLTGAKLKLETYGLLTRSSHQLIDDSQALMLKASHEIRNIINNIQPIELDKYGLISALKNYSNSLLDRHNITLIFNTSIDYIDSEKINLPVYRVVQEILNNIIKHSKATTVSIFISKNNSYFTITISDNGIGFNLDNKTIIENSGRGLGHILLRIENIGGNVVIDSKINEGSKITLNIPVSLI